VDYEIKSQIELVLPITCFNIFILQTPKWFKVKKQLSYNTIVKNMFNSCLNFNQFFDLVGL